MIKSIRFALAAVALCAMPACTGTLPDLGGTPPAPANATVIDEQGLSVAWASLTTVGKAVDTLINLGVIKKGTPTGNLAKSLLLKIEAALDTATAARNALSATSYAAAMREAKVGFDELASLLKG